MNILISAGEPSGDQRGAEVLKKLGLVCEGEIHAFGLGGSRLAEAGMKLTRDMSEYAVMGFTEIAVSLLKFLRLEKDMIAAAKAGKPDIALLIDYPGFNMRLGRKLKKMGVPVVHYVAPQMWAWGRWRVRKLKKSCGLLLTMFHFEEKFFRERGVNAVFTGHPLAADIRENTESGNILGILPGSRAQEVRYLLPPMVKAFEILREKGIAERAVIAMSDHLGKGSYEAFENVPGLDLARGSGYVLRNSRAALVCSGTATLETALHRVPFVVCYKTGTCTFALAKLLVRGVSRIGMANIVAGSDVAPELIQRDVTPEKIAAAVTPLLHNGRYRESVLEGLKAVRANLGAGDPAENAAREILRFAGNKL